jgi:hypothetical protein
MSDATGNPIKDSSLPERALYREAIFGKKKNSHHNTPSGKKEQ